MSFPGRIALILATLLLSPMFAADFPPPSRVSIGDELGRNVQRTMKRLAESRPDARPTVRILFYGQSITEQEWADEITRLLRERYPHVDFVIENRALGGFSSDRLVHTAEADLYPFSPDLVIFYDFGSDDAYEDMIRRLRERTTAEILIQTDHLGAKAKVDEETDPTKISRENWSNWFSTVFLPGIAEKYRTGLVQQRPLWKAYLREHGLAPQALLKDGIHLNAHGNFLMARLVEPHLVRRPELDDPAAEAQIRTHVVGRDVTWKDGRLTLPFVGNRIEVLAGPGASGSAEVRIDGRKPSEFPELFGFTRASGFRGTKWPLLGQVRHHAPLVPETWRARVTDIADEGKTFRFSVEGSVTGPDGEGTSDQPFVSKSGRVVIEPAFWNVAYGISLVRIVESKKGIAVETPRELDVTWEAMPRFVERYVPPTQIDPAGENLVPLVQGLPNGPHTLELIADGAPPAIRAIRTYQPPLTAIPKTQEAKPKGLSVRSALEPGTQLRP